MKQIRVHAIVEPDAASAYSAHRAYSVALGNKRRVQFTSRREAMAFQAATERFLDETMQEVNALLAQALHDYRMAWPALYDRRRPVKGNTQVAMQLALDHATDALDRAATGSDGPNRMHFAWKYLDGAAADVGAFYAELIEWYRYKTQGTWRHQATIAKRRCDEIGVRLGAYGSTPDPPRL